MIKIYRRFSMSAAHLIVIASFLALTIVAQMTCERADASVAADQELASMMAATSLENLSRAVLKASESKSFQEDCTAELEMNVLPRSCFKVQKQSKSQNDHWLEKECVARAKKSSSRRDLNQDNESLPEKCRFAVIERLADLDYLDQNERPSELWTLDRKLN